MDAHEKRGAGKKEEGRGGGREVGSSSGEGKLMGTPFARTWQGERSPHGVRVMAREHVEVRRPRCVEAVRTPRRTGESETSSIARAGHHAPCAGARIFARLVGDETWHIAIIRYEHHVGAGNERACPEAARAPPNAFGFRASWATEVSDGAPDRWARGSSRWPQLRMKW